VNISPEGTSQSSQGIDLIHTEISALDEAFDGGLPRGSLILVGGRAGTGKTLLASRFLYEGARKCGEGGVYVSFLEGRDTFFGFMKRFGYDFAKLEEEGKYRFLGFPTVKEEGASAILAEMIENVRRTGAKRLVIDSFTALAAALPDRTDSRVVLHNVLSKITRAVGCTTLLIAEMPVGARSIGLDIEEFVADSVLVLRRKESDGRLLRVLEVLKARGQRILCPKMVFTLENGFDVHAPLREPTSPPRAVAWKTIPDEKEMFSTGNRELDSLLGGGYERGSYVLIDFGENVPDRVRHLFTRNLMSNFLSQSRGVIVVPRPDSSARKLVEALAKYIAGDKIRSFLRVYEKRGHETDDTVAVTYEGVDNEKDYESDIATWKYLKEKTGQRPVLRVVAEDTDEYTYGAQQILWIITQSITRTAIQRDLAVAVTQPHLECTRHLAQLAKTHLRVREYCGYYLVYGVKPRTAIHIAEIDGRRGAPELRLYPIR